MSQPVRRYRWYGRGTPPLPPVPRAVALGVFDGLHIGHRTVIAQAVGVVPDGAQQPLVPTLVTLSHPGEFKPGSGEALLTDRQQLAVWKTMGIAEWIQADFPTLRDWPPARFVDEFLIEVLHARRVCCGFNYHFGRGAAGDAELLKELCARRGIEVVIVPPVEADGQPVSSRRIRTLLREGDVSKAARLLGRPYTLSRRVIHGQHRGRELGYPTVNQRLPGGVAAPRYGVYVSAVDIDGKMYRGVTNIGVHPTVGAARPQAETWIAGYNGDLYDCPIAVTLLRFLRPERCFDSVEELKVQIARDAHEATAPLPTGIRAVLFDFDDTLQNRSAAFLRYASGLFARYAPQLSPEEVQRRSRELLVLNHGGYVDYPVYFEQVRALNRDISLPSAAVLNQDFQLLFPRETTLFPQVEQTLGLLRQRGYRLGVITNGSPLMQNRKLDHSGLRPYLDIVTVGGDEPAAKPDPSIFERTAARLNLHCENCVFVGDHPTNDVEGAAAVGMQPVLAAIASPPPSSLRVPCIRRVEDLPVLLPDRAGGIWHPAPDAEFLKKP